MFKKLLVLTVVLALVVLGYLGDRVGASDLGSAEPSSSRVITVGQTALSYAVVDTGQRLCYDAAGAEIVCPAAGQAFYGQDAQHIGNAPGYTDNAGPSTGLPTLRSNPGGRCQGADVCQGARAGQAGTITDNVTGLTWQQSPDTDGDGDIDAADKLTYAEAGAYCQNLTLAGHSDWRLPDIKQLYSLIDFGGVDPSGHPGGDTSGLVPFIDTDYFDFAYGDTAAGERIIDAQYASSTLYVANTGGDGGSTMFGVNFADGRIKGYGLSRVGQDKTFYVLCVRGNTSYGVNNFVDNPLTGLPTLRSNPGGRCQGADVCQGARAGQAGTITDRATGLMWSQDDSGTGLNWEQALAWVAQKNAENYLGYSDWRLPDAKELQSIVDYTRSPDTTGSAAIDPLFNVTAITNEAGQTDYPFYWSSTTHANWTATPGASGVYVAFGRALGYMNGAWVDVHGAGAQRSDPKSGDPADWPTGHGPQGDAIRIYNFVRLVRDVEQAPVPSFAVYLPSVGSSR